MFLQTKKIFDNGQLAPSVVKPKYYYCLFKQLPKYDSVAFLYVDGVFIRSGHYNLLGVDVRKEQEVEATLSRAGLQWDVPTLVLSEVVLTYMETQW